jgi:oligogalacturonide lyase
MRFLQFVTSRSLLTVRIFGLLLLICIFSACGSGDKRVESEKSQALPVLETGAEGSMPMIWIDKDTDHKIEKVTARDGDNRSFYFHNNPFLPSGAGTGWLMIFYGDTPRGKQLFSVDLDTKETRQITDHPGELRGEIVGAGSRKVFYTVADSVFSTHIDTRETKLICVFPDGFQGSVSTLNADETLLGCTQVTQEEREILKNNPNKGQYFDKIYEARLPRTLWSIEVATGKFEKIYSENAWLNHVQFSPTEPARLMYCHEGPWHKVDRIWNINVTSKETELLHKRTVDREIAGHEFFSPDGRTIWFDLQIPRGETFYLAGKLLDSGEEIRYVLERNEWSIHFNISPDLKTFAGDGGDEGQVARAKDGRWIYHFTPVEDRLVSEKLVNMKHHDYSLEPNVHFSPDGKKVIFRANFEGRSNIYAVEIDKTEI